MLAWLSDPIPRFLYKYVTADRWDIVRHLQIRFTQLPSPSTTWRSDLNDQAEAQCLYRRSEFTYIESPNSYNIYGTNMGGDSFLAKTLEPAPLAKWTPAKPNYIIGAPPFFRGWQAFKYMRKQHEEKRLDDVICALQGVGVLSLSATPSNAPMWEFYADKQTGMVIKFDTHDSFFRNYLSDKWFRKFRGVFHLGRVKI